MISHVYELEGMRDVKIEGGNLPRARVFEHSGLRMLIILRITRHPTHNS